MFDWRKLKALKEARGEKTQAMQGLIQKSETEKRDLTADEDKQFGELRAEVETLDKQISRYEQMRDVMPGVHVGNGRPPRDGIGTPENRDENSLAFDPRNGEWEKRACKDLPQSEPLSIAKYIRGVMLGDWRGAEAERRAMSTTGTGSVIVPTPLSANLIQGAFNQSRLMQAGARVVPLDTATLKMARIAGAPSAVWKAENQAGTFSDSPLDSVTFTAKTLFAGAQLSLELAEDAKNADAVVQMALNQSLSLALDYAGLFGDGTNNSPTGIAHTSGVQAMASIGTLSDYSKFSKAVQNVWNVNGQPNAILLSPNTAGTLDRLVDTLGQPMRRPSSVDNLPWLPSNQIQCQPIVATVTGSPTGGNFTLTVNAGGTSKTTGNLAYNSSAASIQTALQGLANVGASNCTVTGSSGGPWTISFTPQVGLLGAVTVTADGSGLTGGTSPAVAISATTSAFVGDFGQVLIGMRQQLFIEMSREAADSTNGSAFTNYQMWVRAVMRCDVQIAHPNQLVYMSGITAS